MLSYLDRLILIKLRKMKKHLHLFLTLFMVLLVQVSLAQEKTVSGVVTDEEGMPLPGVNVSIPNTSRGVQTDFDGEYSISASPGEVLVFSFLGLTTVERTVGAASEINVVLESDSEALDEVVVVGYGTQSRRSLTGSISQVKGEEIAGLIAPSFESQLSGRAAGVQVTTSSGIIGETPRFRIRGVSSITSGTYPLVVVDGIPIFTGDLGGYADNNALGDINPNDIASIEILKDGSATAIYGSRAANGVVLITTKTGREGEMRVNVNTTVGFASPVELFDLLGTDDFITISNEKRSNAGLSTWAVGNDYNTDWQKAVLNDNALQQDHNIAFSGGTARTTYFMSLGYTQQESVAKPNDMDRYSFRANMDHEIKEWLSVGANAGFTRTAYSGLNTGASSLSGNIFNATRQHPNVPIYNPDHPSGYNIDFINDDVTGRWDNLESVGDNVPNIMYAIENNGFSSKINRLISNVYADIKPVSFLNFRTQVSVDQANTNGYLYYSPVHGDGSGSGGRVQNNNAELTRWNWQNILSYNDTFAEDHTVGLTLITEYQKQTSQSFFGSGIELSNEFFRHNLISGSYGTQGSGGSLSEKGFISYAGRFNYNFRNKYFLQGTLRRDGISDLPAENRWGTFPGISAGWTISEEAFMDGVELINDFKIRGSYGKVGNVSIGNYPYLGLYSSAKYGDGNGIGYSQFGNNALKWETSTKYDVGFDLRMFDHRLALHFDYFLNDTDDLILDRETPQSFGIPGNSYSANVGAIQNSGVELAAELSLVRSQDFQWNVNANISFLKNEVKTLVDGQDMILNLNKNIIREGEPIYSLYGYRYWGVNPANGNPVYHKADGSLVQGDIESADYFVFDPSNPSDLSTESSLSPTEDRTILGNTLPTYFGGLSSDMKYKNFDFGFMFRFSGGNKIFNETRRELLGMNFTNNSTEILGRWQSAANPGDGVTPRLMAGAATFVNLTSTPTTRFVEDGDFIKLDNVTLGYTLSPEISDRIGVDRLRIFAQGQNLLIISDYKGLDPEMERTGVDFNGTPRSRILSVGLNLGF